MTQKNIDRDCDGPRTAVFGHFIGIMHDVNMVESTRWVIPFICYTVTGHNNLMTPFT